MCSVYNLVFTVVCICLCSSFQQRLSYNTLSDLAQALIDGTVYEIVQGLLDIQHLTEKNLYNQRQKLHCEHQGKHTWFKEASLHISRRKEVKSVSIYDLHVLF